MIGSLKNAVSGIVILIVWVFTYHTLDAWPSLKRAVWKDTLNATKLTSSYMGWCRGRQYTRTGPNSYNKPRLNWQALGAYFMIENSIRGGIHLIFGKDAWNLSWFFLSTVNANDASNHFYLIAKVLWYFICVCELGTHVTLQWQERSNVKLMLKRSEDVTSRTEGLRVKNCSVVGL